MRRVCAAVQTTARHARNCPSRRARRRGAPPKSAQATAALLQPPAAIPRRRSPAKRSSTGRSARPWAQAPERTLSLLLIFPRLSRLINAKGPAIDAFRADSPFCWRGERQPLDGERRMSPFNRVRNARISWECRHQALKRVSECEGHGIPVFPA
jgi:hypothetical protein